MRTELQGLQAIEEAKVLPDLSSQIVRLYAIAIVFYRQDVGDRAWDALREITSPEIVSAIAFLNGFSMGASMRQSRWEDLAFGK